MAGAGVKVRVDAHPEANPQEMADLSGSLTVYARDIYNLAQAVALELIHAGWEYHQVDGKMKLILFVDLRFADSRREWPSTQPAIWRVIPDWDPGKGRFDPLIGSLQPGQFLPDDHNHRPKEVPTSSFEVGLRQILTGVIYEVQHRFWDHLRVQEQVALQTRDQVHLFDPIGSWLFRERSVRGVRFTG